ncbi:MAG TPA: hypothetical protein VEQ85_12830, partial [Lacipirellulaceae bacterium]|nr:hypothetical protein [Lacipirellulaceae bacterium]
AARGAVLVAPTLAVNRGTSQAWINSPGKVHLLMKQDAAGKPLATPQPLEITWQESMALEGDRITFQGDVHVKHADGWLRTRRLTAVLTQAVRFDGAAGGAPPELAQLECHEGARGEAYGRDPAGNTTSHQVFRAESIVINQITGAISGQGPGHLDSIHLSKGDGAWMVLPDVTGAAAPTPPAVPEGPPTLRHLSLDFVRSIEGNIHTPEVRVSGDVRTVYGGVDTWEQRLEMTAGGSPGPDAYWISCDSLLVTDSVLARMQAAGPRRGFGLVELRAETNVVIEAEHPQRGAFTLRGSRATYDQAKAIFVLQGDARTPATVTYQKFPGGPFEEQPADKFMYLQQTGDLRVEGFKKFEMNFFE